MKIVVLLWFSLVLCRFLWFCIAFPWFLYGSSSSCKVFFSLTLPFLLKVLILVSFSMVSFGFLWLNVDLEPPERIWANLGGRPKSWRKSTRNCKEDRWISFSLSRMCQTLEEVNQHLQIGYMQTLFCYFFSFYFVFPCVFWFSVPWESRVTWQVDGLDYSAANFVFIVFTLFWSSLDFFCYECPSVCYSSPDSSVPTIGPAGIYIYIYTLIYHFLTVIHHLGVLVD